MFAPSIASRRRAWVIVAIAASGSGVFLSACSRQPTAKPSGAAPKVRLGSHATIEQPLAFKDISVSFVQTIKRSEHLPEKIRVRYRNTSASRGYFELPSALRPIADFKGFAVAVGLRSADGGEPIFVYYEEDLQQPESKSIAVLDPDATVIVEYSTDKFCMMIHAIAPDPAANLTTCYRAGDDETELRVYLIADFDKLTRTASEPVAIKLSKLDYSMHRELQDAKKTDRQPQGEDP